VLNIILLHSLGVCVFLQTKGCAAHDYVLETIVNVLKITFVGFFNVFDERTRLDIDAHGLKRSNEISCISQAVHINGTAQARRSSMHSASRPTIVDDSFRILRELQRSKR